MFSSASLTPHFCRLPPWQSWLPQGQQTLKPQTPVKIKFQTSQMLKRRNLHFKEKENLADPPPLLAPIRRSALGGIGAVRKISQNSPSVPHLTSSFDASKSSLCLQYCWEIRNQFMFWFIIIEKHEKDAVLINPCPSEIYLICNGASPIICWQTPRAMELVAMSEQKSIVLIICQKLSLIGTHPGLHCLSKREAQHICRIEHLHWIQNCQRLHWDSDC